ncbi:MAG TPA: tetratricopeptide repeat protein [Chloroflexota bacterium]|nr:tetratricopeptide repeat protein [Chloroflexota bacterium]
MGRYFAAVFSDLERHSLVWGRTPRDKMVAIIAEYRYLAESLAGQYGSLHRNFTGDGHLFLFSSPDAAVQLSLKLIERWKDSHQSIPALQGLPHLPLRLGCHFGECTDLDGGEAWVGRSINLAKRVEEAADPDTLYVTETVLELVDLPLYEFRDAGTHALKGDHLSGRTLYQLTAFDQEALDSKPTQELTAEAWFLKAAALVGTDRENSDEEADCYRQALRLRPDYPEAHSHLAVLLKARGDYAAAAEHYRQALRLRPDYPAAHYNYAILLESRASTAGAADHYREALRLRPEYVDAHHGYANLLKAKGDLVAAEEHYREALRLRPDSPEVHNNYAILLEDTGQPAMAAEHYLEALRLRPDYPEAHYNYAILLENGGDVAAAENHYRQALRLLPAYPEAHNNLAILLQSKGDLAGADKHYREALRLRPADPETHHNYALLLKAKGDEPGAEEHFRIAYELAPDPRGTEERHVTHAE